MAWNPQARRSETFPIEASRDEHGNPQAHVTMTAWSAADRLAYMDLTGRSITKAKDGSRTVAIGDLTVEHIARTITAADGFGDITYLDPQRGHSVTQPFDPSKREHLEALSADVLEELAEYAQKVQPTQRKKADDTPLDEDGLTPPTVGPDGEADEIGDADEDPSRA